MTTTATTQTTFYRTGKGKKAHFNFYCALVRKSIWWGDVQAIPADEVTGWAGCLHCCTPAHLAELAEGAPSKEIVNCVNSGVTNPRRLYSNCRDCGKQGKVMASQGRLRAHLPQAA